MAAWQDEKIDGKSMPAVAMLFRRADSVGSIMRAAGQIIMIYFMNDMILRRESMGGKKSARSQQEIATPRRPASSPPPNARRHSHTIFWPLYTYSLDDSCLIEFLLPAYF